MQKRSVRCRVDKSHKIDALQPNIHAVCRAFFNAFQIIVLDKFNLLIDSSWFILDKSAKFDVGSVVLKCKMLYFSKL